jgi:hypothetical protein
MGLISAADRLAPEMAAADVQRMGSPLAITRERD